MLARARTVLLAKSKVPLAAAQGVRRLATAPSVTVTPLRIVLGASAAAGIVGLGAYGAYLSSAPAAGKALGLTDEPWSARVRSRVHSTMAAFGYSVGMTGLAAATAWRAGLAPRLAAVHPALMIGGTLLGSLACIVTLHTTAPDNTPVNAAALTAFAGLNGLTMCGLGGLGSAVLVRAGLYTGGVVGGLSAVAANSPSDRFLGLAGPLSIGLGVVLVSSLGAAFFPASAAAGAMQAVSLYGGVGLFSAFVLYDTSKVIHAAKALPAADDEGRDPFNPYSQCLGIYLDALNLFVRFAAILGGSGGKRK